MTPVASPGPTRRAVQLAVLVAALGYFVDIYDLILFSIVRVRSLTSIGVAPAQLLPMLAAVGEPELETHPARSLPGVGCIGVAPAE